ncbi:MAG: hypothetical protein F4063_05690 [Chloroflexi bacterium]|nr:hypothetical protein [Chloroflexota bacterium]
MMDLLSAKAPGTASLDQIEAALGKGDNGLDELRELAHLLAAADVPAEHIDFDFTMARGLGYYTGPIFETVISQPNLGSITGGGRYDNLIGMFRRQSLPTTGTSFGIERIIDLLDELDLYPAALGGSSVQALVTVFGADTRRESLRIADALRTAGINTELHLEARKLGRQIAYADRKGIPLVAIAGSEEISAGVVKLRRLADRREMDVKREEIGVAAQALLMDADYE